MLIKSPLQSLRRLTILLMVCLLSIYMVFHSFLLLYLGRLKDLITSGSRSVLISPGLTQSIDTSVMLFLLIVTIYSALVISNQLRLSSYEKVISFGLISFTLIVVPAAMLGELADRIGIPLLRPPAGPILSGIPALVICIASIKKGWKLPAIKFPDFSRSKLVIGIFFLCSFTYIAITAVALMHPATGGDALSYHSPLAVLLWREGNLGSFLDHAPQIWALAHPGMAELWFGLLRVGAGEWLANLGQLPFSFLGVAAIYAFARRLGLRSGAALLSGLAFLLVPMVVMQSAMQQNDIVGSVLIMVTIALASASIKTWNIERLILIGAGLGLTVTTKIALLPTAAAVGIFIIGAVIFHSIRSKSWQRVLFPLAIIGFVFLLVVSPWWVRNIIRYQNPIYPSAIPFLGRGVFVPDFGRIDISFVPSPIAWPLYPLIEPHDDRSGFGALFLIGAIPGFLFAFRKAFKQPLIIFGLAALITLPAWWIFTLHEPRFFLGLIGLSFAFIPWAIMAIPKRLRFIGAILILITAIFSISVTFDQDILTFSSQPNDRATFYDTVWGVDGFATSLPENEGLLLNTGFAPTISEYTATYPLLGPNQDRTLLPIDGVHDTASIVEEMKSSGIRYAYVASSPQNVQEVRKIYNSTYFDLVHQSSIVVGGKSGARRFLYRAAMDPEQDFATQRYLFQLK